MTFDDYQQGALITEAPITDQVRERFQSCRPLLSKMLLNNEYWNNANDVKRFIFYGKPLVRSLEVLMTVLWVQNPTADNVPSGDPFIRLIHGWLGLLSEIPELAQAILNQDFPNIGEESGDFKWYTALVDSACNFSSGNVATANLNKLKARYPDKFTEHSALNRNLKQEAEELADILFAE